MGFWSADSLCVTDKRLNVHGKQIFVRADDVILAEEFDVFVRAFLLKLCANSGSALVNDVSRARLEAVFSLNGVLDAENSNGSGDVFS